MHPVAPTGAITGTRPKPYYPFQANFDNCCLKKLSKVHVLPDIYKASPCQSLLHHKNKHTCLQEDMSFLG